MDNNSNVDSYGRDDPLSVFLESALSSSSDSSSFGLKPRDLHALDDDNLVEYSLLIMSILGKLGSAVETSTSSSSSIGSSRAATENLTALLDTFCNRMSSSRPLKLRAAILAHVADLGISEQWDANIVFDPDCYENDLASSSAASIEELGGSLAASTNSDSLDTSDRLSPQVLLEDDTLLNEYVFDRFFHPKNGIDLKTERRHLVKSYPNAFSEHHALLFLMQDLNIDQNLASQIGQHMVDRGLIQKASGGTLPPGSFTSSKAFGLGKSVYVRSGNATARGHHRRSVKALSVPITSKEAQDVASGIISRIDVSFGLDVVDLQSINFWRNSLWDKSPLVEGSDFGTVAVVHPMVTSSSSVDHPTTSCGGYIVHNVAVKKVFSSMAKPAFLSLTAYDPGASISISSSSPGVAAVEIQPRVIAKKGDNLLNDMSVELMFRIFTHVWRQDDTRFGGASRAPFSYSYDVLPCGRRVGLLEVLTGLESLNDFDWTSWVAKYSKDDKVLDSICRSAAGCSIATFVLGCGDRHWDNIQIKDDKIMLHIDFGMILGENPAFKTPRFSISAGQEAAFREVGIWDRFVELCGQAFLSLRARAPALMNIIALVLQHAGRPQKKILKYLASFESFNIGEKNEDTAKQIVCKQVMESSGHWETIMRKFTHDRIDPIFLKAVEKTPESLVAAVEKMYNKT